MNKIFMVSPKMLESWEDWVIGCDAEAECSPKTFLEKLKQQKFSLGNRKHNSCL